MGLRKIIFNFTALFIIFNISGCDNLNLDSEKNILADDTVTTSENGSALNLSSGGIEYEIGTGISDITGPSAEVMFAGYCDFAQLGTGLYMRQWSRAFIVKDIDSNKSTVFVVADIPMMASGITE